MYWNDVLNNSSLSSLAKAARNPSVAWPRIETKYAYDPRPQADREAGYRALKLGERLRATLAKIFIPDIQPDFAAAKQDIADFESIGSGLVGAGGYTNLLLRDEITRLELLRVIDWVIIEPTQLEKGRELLQAVDAMPVHLADLLNELASQDPLLNDKRENLDKIGPNELLLQSLRDIGFPPKELGTILIPKLLKTSVLIENPSGIALVHRMALTESSRWIEVRGLIDFLASGGTPVELNHGDVRPFRARMAAKADKYKYPLLNIRSLKVENIYKLYAFHNMPSFREGYLDIAIR